MAEKKNIGIGKNRDQPVTMDFRELRQHGIEWVQKLSGHIWTDFNLHDPGVTILEMLCIAITDLSYRTDFPIQDLLADHLGHIPAAKNTFFPKQDILTTNPVTTNDIRRAIRDEVEGVYNVWVEPVLSRHSTDSVRGVYTVFVQMTKDAASRPGDRETKEKQIRGQVRKSFVSKRNLCEDWVRDIIILSPVEINISAEVVAVENAIPEDVLAGIYGGLENYLNPPVKFYSEKDLLKEGFGVEDIYACTLLKRGFIPTDKISPRRRIIDPDEIIKVIMQVEGVMSVKNLVIQTPEGSTVGRPYRLGELNFAYLADNVAAPSIGIFKGKNKSLIDIGVFQNLLMKVQEVSRRTFVSSFRNNNLHEPPVGTFRDLEHYFSIQDHFPLIYGIGEEGPAPGESEEHRAEIKQLKSYLMIFEQLLADYLSQLAHGKDLFSTDLSGWGTSTYYHQPLYQVPGAKNLLKAFTKINREQTDEEWEQFKRDNKNEYVRFLQNDLESNGTYRDRKNRVFDHLLARFNVVLDDFPVKLFITLYGDPAAENRANEVLEWKSGILNNMVELGHDRIKAIDYLSDPEDSTYFSGFQKRLSMLLYIRNNNRRPLSNVFDLKKDPSSDGKMYVNGLTLQRKKKEKDNPEPDGEDNLLTNGFDFGDQTNDIFKYGTDLNNYKIISDAEDSKGFKITYKSPDKEQWSDLSRNYSNKFSATASMHEMVNYMKQLSVASEGFHIVEHTLLRPELKSPSFGFGFYGDMHSLLFRHHQWYRFSEREKMLNEISNIAGSAESASQLPGKIKLPDDNGRSLDTIIKNLRMKNGKEARFYPRYELWVRMSDEFVIRENYFNFRMSVVFPAWPARFQDNDFRQFAEDLFVVQTPAHIKIKFYWLDIFQMKKFEDIYFEWMASLRKPEHGVADIGLSEKLIQILNGTDFRVTGI